MPIKYMLLHRIITRMKKTLTHRSLLIEEQGQARMVGDDGDPDEACVALWPLEAVGLYLPQTGSA